jgi:nicotinate-nucleotide adenylyltransferase
VFGGTFDPPHKAHLAIARTARREAGLDLVLFVVAARPPHKRRIFVTAGERYQMVEAAVAGEEGMEASRLELDRGGPSYTADTLRELERIYPGAELRLILGQDSLVDLPKWRAPEEILERCRLLVVSRPGEEGAPSELEGKYDLLPFRERDISSTEIRERLLEGRPLDDLVPEPVERLIRQRDLYRDDSANQ